MMAETYISKKHSIIAATGLEQSIYRINDTLIAADNPKDLRTVARLADTSIKYEKILEVLLEQSRSGKVYILGKENLVVARDVNNIPYSPEQGIEQALLQLWQNNPSQLGLRINGEAKLLFSPKTRLEYSSDHFKNNRPDQTKQEQNNRTYQALETNLQQRMEIEGKHSWSGFRNILRNATDEYRRLKLKDETQDILHSYMKGSSLFGRIMLKDRLQTVEKSQTKMTVKKQRISKENIQMLLDEEYQPRNIRSLIIADKGDELGWHLQREAGCQAKKLRNTQYTLLTGPKKDIHRLIQMHNTKAYSGVSTQLKMLMSRSRLYFNKGVYIPELIAEFTEHKIKKTRSSNMWNLQNIGAYEAQSVTRGEGAKVAIIDTGVDYNHAELIQLFGKEKGYDFVLDNDKPLDRNGHGTHVAGTTGGKNVGIATGCSMFSLRVLNENGAGTLAGIIEAVSWAVLKKYDVLNLSLGSKEYSRIEYETFVEAARQGIIICAAAGNDQYGPDYPAAYDCVTAVAAVDRNNEHAYFSNMQDTNNISAPGVGIYSSIPNNRFDSLNGTSMASPHTAAGAALSKSLNPGIDNQGFVVLLEKTAEPLGDRNDEDNRATYGAGLIRLDRIVRQINGR